MTYDRGWIFVQPVVCLSPPRPELILKIRSPRPLTVPQLLPQNVFIFMDRMELPGKVHPPTMMNPPSGMDLDPTFQIRFYALSAPLFVCLPLTTTGPLLGPLPRPPPPHLLSHSVSAPNCRIMSDSDPVLTAPNFGATMNPNHSDFW